MADKQTRIHKWESDGMVIDTLPPLYTRWCISCGLIQEQYGNEGWHNVKPISIRGIQRLNAKAIKRLSSRLLPFGNISIITHNWNEQLLLNNCNKRNKE
jgi:hypothetical protein